MASDAHAALASLPEEVVQRIRAALAPSRALLKAERKFSRHEYREAVTALCDLESVMGDASEEVQHLFRKNRAQYFAEQRVTATVCELMKSVTQRMLNKDTFVPNDLQLLLRIVSNCFNDTHNDFSGDRFTHAENGAAWLHGVGLETCLCKLIPLWETFENPNIAAQMGDLVARLWRGSNLLSTGALLTAVTLLFDSGLVAVCGAHILTSLAMSVLGVCYLVNDSRAMRRKMNKDDYGRFLTLSKVHARTLLVNYGRLEESDQEARRVMVKLAIACVTASNLGMREASQLMLYSVRMLATSMDRGQRNTALDFIMRFVTYSVHINDKWLTSDGTGPESASEWLQMAFNMDFLPDEWKDDAAPLSQLIDWIYAKEETVNLSIHVRCLLAARAPVRRLFWNSFLCSFDTSPPSVPNRAGVKALFQFYTTCRTEFATSVVATKFEKDVMTALALTGSESFMVAFMADLIRCGGFSDGTAANAFFLLEDHHKLVSRAAHAHSRVYDSIYVMMYFMTHSTAALAHAETMFAFANDMGMGRNIHIAPANMRIAADFMSTFALTFHGSSLKAQYFQSSYSNFRWGRVASNKFASDPSCELAASTAAGLYASLLMITLMSPLHPAEAIQDWAAHVIFWKDKAETLGTRHDRRSLDAASHADTDRSVALASAYFADKWIRTADLMAYASVTQVRLRRQAVFLCAETLVKYCREILADPLVTETDHADTREAAAEALEILQPFLIKAEEVSKTRGASLGLMKLAQSALYSRIWGTAHVYT